MASDSPIGRPAKALVAGWFSYRGGHATGGDLLARDVLCEWLTELGIDHVTAYAAPFGTGPRIDQVDPGEFTHAFLVCGPFDPGPLEADFLTRFAGCRLIGIDLSLDLPRSEWQPFDLLIERDSDERTNPDIVFAGRGELPPVIGVCLVEEHPEADVERANSAIERLLGRNEAARVAIDTRLDVNETGLRTKGEIEALIRRVDVVVTTRLHGLVLALKNGVPVVAIDAVRGSGKITRQCLRIGWPVVLGLDELDDARLDQALAFALSAEGRTKARECGDQAIVDVTAIREELARELTGSGSLEANFAQRQTEAGMQRFTASLPRTHGGLLGRIRRSLSPIF